MSVRVTHVFAHASGSQARLSELLEVQMAFEQLLRAEDEIQVLEGSECP